VTAPPDVTRPSHPAAAVRVQCVTAHIDPYATLGIPPGASRTEAARAHRRLAKQFHPDVNPGPAAADRMRRINEAWRILSAGSWVAAAGPRTTTATWTHWPEQRGTVPPRTARPPRPDPVEPSFGDRPSVIVLVWLGLSLFFFIGSWLGSLAR